MIGLNLRRKTARATDLWLRGAMEVMRVEDQNVSMLQLHDSAMLSKRKISTFHPPANIKANQNGKSGILQVLM